MWDVPLLGLAGFAAGAMNAAGGGGSFVTLPAFIAVGVPSVNANASSAVALFPGSVLSTWVCRDGLVAFSAVPLRALVLSSVAGGLVGAALLVSTPQADFDAALPWLLLWATVVFAFGRSLGAALRRRLHVGRATLLVVQFGLGVYGGYFGGAVGIMMLAVWSLLSGAGLRAMNPPKTLMVAAANAIAVTYFVAAGHVSWRETVPVLLAATVGGHVGARAAQRIDARLIRAVIVLVTAAMTIAFFLRPR
jgi:uncharacterized membrane protein YfcA